MLDWLEIYTFGDFITLLGCMALASAVVLPIAVILYFLGKLFILGIDKAYGCVVELKHNNNKCKKGE